LFAHITHRRIDLKKARSSLVIIGALAMITFALVAGVLATAQKKMPVVVAVRALEAGTKLSLADVQVVEVHTGAVLESAFETVEDVTGLVITVQRLPGDQVTADMVGDAAQNAMAQALDPDHRAVAVHVDQASGLAGLLRPGDTVSAVGIVDPSTLGGLGYQRATGAGAKVLLSGLKVLFVPYEFRYRELNPEDSGNLLSPVMASSEGREKGVVVLSVPVQPITITWEISAAVPAATDVRPSGTTSPTVGASGTTTETILIGAPTPTASETTPDANPALRVSPVEMLALLDSQAQVYLVMEPTSKSDDVQTPGVYLVDLLPDVATAPETDEPETVFVGGQR
jgi:Flp pilus assembly protein CpaB